MGQIVMRKGRPSKTDLARRTPTTDTAALEVRRSLRRRRCLRYTLDYDDEQTEEGDDDEEACDDEEERIREKKLKLVLKLPTCTNPKIIAEDGRWKMAPASVRHAPLSTVSASSSENIPLKKRRINGDGVLCRNGGYCSDDDYDGGYEVTGGNKGASGPVSPSGSFPDFFDPQSTPSASSSDLPLPEKKSLELILDKLQKKDIYGVYADPVDPEELPDYHDIIEHPMDFATVRKKLGNGSYSTLKDFESDVFLISSNALQYNASDTIYYKQALSIKELARKKFERLRIDIGCLEREKPSQKVILDLSANKEICKTSFMSFQEPIGSDFSSGATLATAGDTQNAINTSQISFDRHNRPDVAVEANSSVIDANCEKAFELQSGKGLLQSKFGRRSAVVEDNPRATYGISGSSKDETVFSAFEAEPKHLVPVGLNAEYSYARSLSLFSAALGSDAWRASANRIEQALPPGFKFGRGWVGEYELPLDSSIVPRCRNQKQPNGSVTPVLDRSTKYSEQQQFANGTATPGRENIKRPQSANGMVTPGPDGSAEYSKQQLFPDGGVPPGLRHSAEHNNQQPFANGMATPGLENQKRLANRMVTPGHGYVKQRQSSNAMMTPGCGESAEHSKQQLFTNGGVTPGLHGSAEHNNRQQFTDGGRLTPGHDESAEHNNRRRFTNGVVTPGHDQYSRENKQKQQFANGTVTPGHLEWAKYSKQEPPNGMVTLGHDQSAKNKQHGERNQSPNGDGGEEIGSTAAIRGGEEEKKATAAMVIAGEMERSQISADSLYNPARSQPHQSLPFPVRGVGVQPAAGIWQRRGEKRGGRKQERSPPDLNIGYHQWLGPPSGVLLDPHQPDLALQL